MLPKFSPYGEGNRETQTRVKVELIPITPTSNNLEWNRITNNYVSEKEMVQKLKSLGYDVTNLNDIVGLKDIKYEIKQTYKKAL